MTWTQTYCGVQFWPLEPRIEDVRLEDITHALSMICRFNGHTKRFYSVAEHSVHVASLLPRRLELVGLLHDAAEAYISDVSRPVKPAIPQYKEIENRIAAVILGAFGFLPTPEDWRLVKYADDQVLAAERDQCMGIRPVEWDFLPEPPRDLQIRFWPPHQAKEIFSTQLYFYEGWFHEYLPV